MDRGFGVPSEDLERIFDKFYRVHRPAGVSGTGLGLAICKGIVEAHRWPNLGAQPHRRRNHLHRGFAVRADQGDCRE